MTALQLFRRLQASRCVPTVAPANKLIFDKRPSDDLIEYIRPLQSGLRSIVTGRPWFYTAIPGFHRAGGQLDPNMLIPETALLLTVAGDEGWDTVLAAWHKRFPEIFTSKQKARAA
jgi:hypothetical protein